MYSVCQLADPSNQFWMITNNYSPHVGRTEVGLTSGLWLASFQPQWMEETDRILPIFGLFSNKAKKKILSNKSTVAASSKGKEIQILNWRVQIDSINLLRLGNFICQWENSLKCKGPFSPQLSKSNHLAFFLSYQNSVNYVLKLEFYGFFSTMIDYLLVSHFTRFFPWSCDRRLFPGK